MMWLQAETGILTRKLAPHLRAHIPCSSTAERAPFTKCSEQTREDGVGEAFSVYGRNVLPPEVLVIWKAMELQPQLPCRIRCAIQMSSANILHFGIYSCHKLPNNGGPITWGLRSLNPFAQIKPESKKDRGNRERIKPS